MTLDTSLGTKEHLLTTHHHTKGFLLNNALSQQKQSRMASTFTSPLAPPHPPFIMPFLIHLFIYISKMPYRIDRETGLQVRRPTAGRADKNTSRPLMPPSGEGISWVTPTSQSRERTILIIKHVTCAPIHFLGHGATCAPIHFPGHGAKTTH